VLVRDDTGPGSAGAQDAGQDGRHKCAHNSKPSVG
jgi:hypothetical protein